eukprot:scaffold3836_cov417-Prasinococcus_capsulatus_cf.AAC.6
MSQALLCGTQRLNSKRKAVEHCDGAGATLRHLSTRAPVDPRPATRERPRDARGAATGGAGL